MFMRLSNKVMFKKLTENLNQYNELEVSYENFKIKFIAIENLQFSQRETSLKQNDFICTHVAIARVDESIASGMRFDYMGVVFEIQYVKFDSKSRYMELYSVQITNK